MNSNIVQPTQRVTPSIQTPVIEPIKVTSNILSSKTKYILLGALIFLILLALGGGMYYLGVIKERLTSQKNNPTTFTTKTQPTSTLPQTTALQQITFKVVFVKPNINYIWIANLDGSKQQEFNGQQLKQYYKPVVSPDSEYAAFITTNDTLIIVNTQNLQSITVPITKINNSSSAYKLIWSPNSKMLAVSSSVETFIINTDGSQKRKVAITNGSILWSPDSQQIAVYYPKNLYIGGEGDPTINTVTVFTKGGVKVTSYSLSGNITYGGGAYWSPVDKRIYFVQDGNGIGIFALWSSNLDGTDQKELVGLVGNAVEKQDPTLFKSAIVGASNIDFSPDGKTILTSRQPYYVNGQSLIWTMNYDGTNSQPIQALSSYKNVSYVKWLPDGKHFTFEVYDGINDALYISDTSGITPVTLYSLPAR